MTTPTPDELRNAWRAMAQRRGLQHWPATFEEVMADHLRSRLVSIEATAARHRRPAPGHPTERPRRPITPTHRTPDLFDRKRAAAGDLDD